MRRIRLLSDRIDGAMIIHFEIPATQDHPEILIVFRQHRLAQPVGFAVCDQGEDASAPIFNKTLKLGKALSKADRWMCYFSNDLTMTEKWEALQGDDLMTQAMTVANDFFNSPAEFKRYQDREMYRRDRESEREGLLERGIVIGEERGTENAIAKLINLLPIAEIARLFSRSEDQVRDIANRYHIRIS